MTETREVYVAEETDEFQQLRRDLAVMEAERVANLPRDEVIYEVGGECDDCDNDQEMIDRLAVLVAEGRQRERKIKKALHYWMDTTDKARRRAAKLEIHNKELAVANHRLNERVREVDYDLRNLSEQIAVRPGPICEDDLPHHHYCGDCGTLLQIVRPGKWQCPECE